MTPIYFIKCYMYEKKLIKKIVVQFELVQIKIETLKMFSVIVRSVCA